MTKFQSVIDSYSSEQNNRSGKFRVLLEHYLTSTERRLYKAMELKIENDLSQWDICFLLGVQQSRLSYVIKQSSRRLGQIDAILRHPRLQYEIDTLTAALSSRDLDFADNLLSGAFMRSPGFTREGYRNIVKTAGQLKLPLLLSLFQHAKRAKPA